MTDVAALSRLQVGELLRFFEDYKTLEGKQVEVDHPLGREAALHARQEAELRQAGSPRGT